MAGGDIDWTCVQCKIVQDGGTKKMKGKRHLITLFLGTCTGSQILEPLLNHGQSDRMWQIKWCSVMLYVSDSVTFITQDHRSLQICVKGCSGFSRMRSKGSRFTLGVWGLRVCSQPFATVRNRSQPFVWGPYGRAYGKFCRSSIFGGFQRFVASFRVAGVALCDIQTCSVTCRKSFCVAGAILLRRFQKMRGSLRGRRSTLDGSIVILRGRRSTLDVLWRMFFFANRIGRAASSGDKVQIPWQAWHFVRCTENWRKPRTKYRFWGSRFSGS